MYVNGAKEAEFTPFFPPSNKVGTAMRNNMKAKMETRNLEICQGKFMISVLGLQQRYVLGILHDFM